MSVYLQMPSEQVREQVLTKAVRAMTLFATKIEAYIKEYNTLKTLKLSNNSAMLPMGVAEGMKAFTMTREVKMGKKTIKCNYMYNENNVSVIHVTCGSDTWYIDHNCCGIMGPELVVDVVPHTNRRGKDYVWMDDILTAGDGAGLMKYFNKSMDLDEALLKLKK